MKITIKRIIILLTVSIAACLIIYLFFVGYALYSLSSGCGMDDGPFIATRVNNTDPHGKFESFEIDNGILVICNRNDSLPPVIYLIENNMIIWTLEMDVSKNKGYEDSRIFSINEISITAKSDPVEMTFTSCWSYGCERGSMEINRKTGENEFCLSW